MILLTGGTGFVGRHLVSQFVADNRRVRVLSRTPSTVSPTDSVSWALGDLADATSLRAALRDVRTVVHAAAALPGGLTPDADFERVNAVGTETLATAARQMGVRQFIHIGSAGVYGDGFTATPHRETDAPDPGTPYELSKLSAEGALASALEGSNVQWLILRPQGLYGHDRPATAAFFRMVARTKFWFHGSTRVLVHPTHVADLVAAVQLVVDRDDLQREVINIGGARPVEFPELISLIGANVGHTPFQFSVPRWTRPLAAMASQAWAAVGKPPSFLARLSRACVNRAVNTEKACRLLGFAPVALEWGLDQTAAELRQKGLL